VFHTFIVDFYCPQAKLIVEVDGGIHDRQAEYDLERSLILQALGCEVIRIRNEEVENDMDRVLAKILSRCSNEKILRKEWNE